MSVLLAANFMFAAPVKAQSQIDPAMKAVKVKFFGGFTGFDAETYQIFRTVLGQMFVDGRLSKIVTLEIGKEGGGSFCLELNPINKDLVVQDVLRPLRALKPNENTFYRYEILDQCN